MSDADPMSAFTGFLSVQVEDAVSANQTRIGFVKVEASYDWSVALQVEPKVHDGQAAAPRSCTSCHLRGACMARVYQTE